LNKIEIKSPSKEKRQTKNALKKNVADSILRALTSKIEFCDADLGLGVKII
jgi:hypothetical protein